MRYQGVVKLVLSVCLGFGLVAMTAQYVGLVINTTASLPQRYFLKLPKVRPKLNYYVLVKSKWYGGRVIKKIVGVAGDRVWYNAAGELLVNSKMIGKIMPVATDGRALHPLAAQIIPPGQVFVAGPHRRSFDSRYQELGLVAETALEGVVIPLR